MKIRRIFDNMKVFIALPLQWVRISKNEWKAEPFGELGEPRFKIVKDLDDFDVHYNGEFFGSADDYERAAGKCQSLYEFALTKVLGVANAVI